MARSSHWARLHALEKRLPPAFESITITRTLVSPNRTEHEVFGPPVVLGVFQRWRNQRNGLGIVEVFDPPRPKEQLPGEVMPEAVNRARMRPNC